MSAHPAVDVVVPDWIDDPARPSGGNTYDRHICAGLTARGWDVRRHPTAGGWPVPAPSDLARLGTVLDGIPDHAVVLVDGLIGSAARSVLVPRASRLRFVVLVHLPLGVGGAVAPTVVRNERSVLTAVSAVITTSRWTRGWLVDRYGLAPGAVHAVLPGVDTAEVTAPTPDGGRLLCVAAVTPVKGHDVLLDALAGLDDMQWQLACVGSPTADPGFAERVRRRFGPQLAGRVGWPGPLTGPRLAAAYAAADLLLVPSRAETYGLVAVEALARAVPVIGSAVGGLPEALGMEPDGSGPDGTGPDGTGPDGTAPALLVPPGDPVALRAAIRRWLSEPALRRDLRAAALVRRAHLRSWVDTGTELSEILASLAAETCLPAGTR